MAVLGLHCCAGFPQVVSWGFSWAAYCRGVSSWGAQVLGGTRFRSCVTQALEHGLTASQHVESSWIRDQTMSPALAGRFFTTEPPRKSTK